MNNKEKERELTPKQTTHVVNPKFAKDLHHQRNRPLVSRFTLCMPNGFLISVPIYEGESFKAKIKSFVDNWYKATKEDPKKFDHFIINDKCPKCGGEMHAKIHNNQCFIWCVNHPNCNYQACEEDKDKVRERIYEKHGLKVGFVHKTGCAIFFSNKPIKK